MLAKSASRGKIFANKPNLLWVLTWDFWKPMGHYYEQMWIKIFQLSIFDNQVFCICWLDVVFCGRQTNLSNLILVLSKSIKYVLIKYFHELFVNMHFFLLLCILPQIQDLFHYHWICFASSRSQRVCLTESIFSNTVCTMILTKIVRK